MKESRRQKMTLLLDDETIAFLKKYSYIKIGTTNVSNAVRLMVREYDKRQIEEHN